MSGALLGPPVILLVQLLALYVLGSYAMASLGSLGFGAGSSRTGRLLFYLLVAPGVIAHESAHFLSAKLTGTPVGRFVPFAPRADESGNVRLGYVTHAARGPLTSAAIGLAPVVANPLALVLLTSVITPLEPLAGTSSFSSAAGVEKLGGAGVVQIIAELGAQARIFLSEAPVLFLLWSYLALSLSLGSVPSRSDLAAVPAALFLVGLGGILYASVLGAGFLWGLSQAAAYGISLYLLPLLVAGVAAAAAALSR